eukprot:3715493-Amphidinium_carterae.2
MPCQSCQPPPKKAPVQEHSNSKPQKREREREKRAKGLRDLKHDDVVCPTSAGCGISCCWPLAEQGGVLRENLVCSRGLHDSSMRLRCVEGLLWPQTAWLAERLQVVESSLSSCVAKSCLCSASCAPYLPEAPKPP